MVVGPVVFWCRAAIFSHCRNERGFGSGWTVQRMGPLEKPAQNRTA